jgi:hypothetical protein
MTDSLKWVVPVRRIRSLPRQGICVAKGYKRRGYHNPGTNTWVSPPWPGKSPTPVNTPFSRDLKDWRVSPPRKYTYTGSTKTLRVDTSEDKTTHYIPKGDRQTWSQAQYTVYKEEQQAFREVKWAKRKTQLDETIEELKTKAKKGVSYIRDANMNRHVRGMVLGRKHGQPAVAKDDKGMPIVEKVDKVEEESSDDNDESDCSDDEKQSAAKVMTDDVAGSSTAAQSVKIGLARYINDPEDKRLDGHEQSGSRKRAHISDSEEEEEEPLPAKASKAKSKKKGKINNKNKKKTQKSRKKWVVPESSDEGEDETEYMRKHGLNIIHDYWPSRWRFTAANEVNSERINKTVSLGN